MSHRVFALVLASLASVALAPQAPALAAAGGATSERPLVGPIELTIDAEAFDSFLGPLLETTIDVENHGPTPARVLPLGRVVWPDGSTQLLRYGPPVTVEPGHGFVLHALSVVPEDVGSGGGTFTATVFVASLGAGGHGAYGGRLIARAEAPFVVP